MESVAELESRTTPEGVTCVERGASPVFIEARPYPGRSAWTQALAMTVPIVLFGTLGHLRHHPLLEALGLTLLAGLVSAPFYAFGARRARVQIRFFTDSVLIQDVHYRFADGWIFEAARGGLLSFGRWVLRIRRADGTLIRTPHRNLLPDQAKYIDEQIRDAAARFGAAAR